jgi:hypothetical protein
VAGPPGFEPGISGLEGRRALWIKPHAFLSKLRHGPSADFHMKSVEDIVLLGLIYTDRKILLKTFKGEFSFFKLEGEGKLV